MIHSDSDFATVAYLRIGKASLAPKSTVGYTVDVPPLLGDQYATMVVDLHGYPSSESHTSTSGIHERVADIYPSSTSKGSWVSVTNIQRSNGLHGGFPEITIEDEVTECFGIMKGEMHGD